MSTSDFRLPEFEKIMKDDLLVYIKQNSPWDTDRLLWLIDTSLRSEPQLGFRISWLIDHILYPNFNFDHEVEGALVEGLLTTDNSSIRRHFAKILALGNCSEEALGKLLDFSFSELNNPEEKVAVKAHLLGILTQACQLYPELIPELRSTLDLMQETASTGLAGRMKRCRKEIKRIENKLKR